ncbi:hypothetical protein NVS55_08670 [Myxococcus stipitatus]|uniref:hypothetical protein n=1 Tax=Myxococcus stipitatus TaxID=83455 RepID=UPI003145199B
MPVAFSGARLLLVPLLVALCPLTGLAQTPPPDAGTGSGAAGPGAVAAPPPKPWVCPPAQRVTLVPKALKTQLGAATRFAEVKKLLAPLRLAFEGNSYASCEKDAPASVVLDVFRARIVSAETEDVVLQARGKICDDQPFFAGMVLHPLAEKNAYCALSMPFLPGGLESSYGLEHKLVFAFENVTDPVRKAFKVEYSSCHRFCDHVVSYWEARDGALRSLFELEWSDGSSASISLEGKEFPRKLRLIETSSRCGSEVTLPSGAVERLPGCDEASNEVLYCYQGDGFRKCGLHSLDD